MFKADSLNANNLECFPNTNLLWKIIANINNYTHKTIQFIDAETW